MNQPDKEKKKFTFYEHEEVFDDMRKQAKEETEKLGRIVTVPEIIRRLTLENTNKRRKKDGKKLIDYDTSAGKFAPGGVGSAAHAIVDMKGNITVYDRKGNKLPEFKTVKDIPHLLRLYPKCKITYEAPGIKAKVA